MFHVRRGIPDLVAGGPTTRGLVPQAQDAFPSAVETSVDVELIIPIRPRYPALARRRDEVNEFLIVIDAQIEQ